MRQAGRPLARRVLAYLRPYRRDAAVVLVLTLLESVVAIVPLLAAKVLVDHLTSSKLAFAGLIAPVGVAVAAALIATLMGIGVAYLIERVSEDVVYDLREQVFDRLVDHGSAFYTHNRAGDVLARMLGDIGAVDTTLSTTLLSLVQSSLTLLATVVVSFALDWRLALIALVLVPLIAVPTRRAGRRISRARGEVQEQLAAMTSYLQETLGLSGMLLVRVFGRQDAERLRFRAVNSEMRRREIAATMTQQRFTTPLPLLGSIIPIAILLVGGVLVIHHLTSPGTVIVFAVMIATRLMTSLQSAAKAAADALGSGAVWKRIFTTLDHRPEIVERPGARRLAAPEGAVRLEQVTFTYPGQSRPAVAEVSFAAEPGQLVALVGPSGAGKTTIAALVARLLDPQVGRVLLDEHDVRDLTLATISEVVGLVTQETFLFHASLRDNLLYGRPEAGEAALVAAARDAYLEEVVARLPDGYDTIVGERGHRLSGGERQRVAIARTMIRDPRVLVLDEATSHLDSHSERLVQAGLERIMSGRTAIVIAHRLSTVLHADQLVVLDEGRVLERGTHSELVQSGGMYAHLHALQTG